MDIECEVSVMMDCENTMSIKNLDLCTSTENDKENILNLSDYKKKSPQQVKSDEDEQK